MTRDEFLTEPRIAIVATEGADGSAYLSAVWFEFIDGAFFVPTGGRSRKARNALARPRGSIAIEERGGTLRGAAARGSFEVIDGAEALALNERLHRRYVTDAGMADPDLGGALTDADDVTLKLTPEAWTEWDMGEMGRRLGDPRFAHPLAP
ncbi:MAG TPA: pyridoxamine 5'-phosphate oxidase family protein [Solirubrobacterales bacterium]